ncbi:MAG: enoyl-CoA hydratase-related protein [Candidatus Eisenbacteria bacterium]
MSKLQITDHGLIREVRLDRPEVHNAFDPELIDLLHRTFLEIRNEVASGNAELRAVLLSGSGKSFCAGADLGYMSSIASFGEAENIADADRLSGMLRAIRTCPVYVVARVHGAALGGGTGLLAACDLVVASNEAIFGFTEVRLGILPAVISPFVIERIGPSHARRLFPSGVRFDATEALRIGLVDRIVPPMQLDQAIEKELSALLTAAPQASREAKRLVETIGAALVARDEETLYGETARWIARLRASEEGQEGMQAFFEKRPARWVRALPPLTAPPSSGEV